MTKNNEQIIIDGVDVKDCKRRIGKENYCRYYKRPCAENNYNCIWKKYLRKEQECEELKIYIESNEQQVKEVEKLVMDNDRLINELDQLKVELEQEKAWHKTSDEISKANSEYAYKLKQTLEEIKKLLLRTGTDSQEHCVNTKSVILQKIKEVINE